MLLDKNGILKTSDLKIEKVEAANGDFTFVRALPMSELDDFDSENYLLDGKMVKFNRRDYRARLLARAICDDKGTPLFTLKEVGALGKKGGKFLTDCFAAAQRLNGLSGDEDIEIATKNSPTEPDDILPSSLPAN